VETFDKLAAIYAMVRRVNDEPQEGAPVSEAHVLSIFRASGLEPERTLTRLYGLHNGVYHLDAFLHFLSAEDALAYYARFQNFKAEWPDFFWQDTWLPIFDMNGDVQVCVDLASGQLNTIDMEGDSTRCIAQHYNAFVDALYEIFSTGKYHYDPGSGSIEVDDAAWREIAGRFGIVGLGDVW
jgi:hypothetical protein